MKYLKDYKIVIILLLIIVTLIIARILKKNYYDLSVQETYERSLKTDEFISYQEYKNTDKEYYVVDLRNAEEFNKSHVKGAVNIPYQKLMNQVEYKNKNRKWLLYSGDVSKTVKAKLILNQMGFLNVYYLDFSDEPDTSEFISLNSIRMDEKLKYKFRPDTAIKPEL